MKRLWWVLAACSALVFTSPAQAQCAAVLARVAPQACTEPSFANLWAQLDRLETPAVAATRARFERVLRVCRGLPGSDPMPCLERRVWLRIAELARSSDSASSVGRYLGPAGQAVEIWPPDAVGYTPVTIRMPQPQDRTCTLDLTMWRLRGELTFVGELRSGDPASYCDVRLRRIGGQVILGGQAQCRAVCAPDADYRGEYLQLK
jgi:hypothetical protein